MLIYELLLISLISAVAWGVADGGNVITPTGEMIFYGVLDLLAKPVFCFYHCWTLSRLDYTRFGLGSGKYSETRTADEKYWHDSSIGQLSGHLTGPQTSRTAPSEPRQSTATAVEPESSRLHGQTHGKPVAQHA